MSTRSQWHKIVDCYETEHYFNLAYLQSFHVDGADQIWLYFGHWNRAIDVEGNADAEFSRILQALQIPQASKS